MAQCLDEWGQWSNDREAELGARACTALNDVLRKCNGSLEDLCVKLESPLEWPTNDLVLLPEVRRIVLDGIQVNNRNFARLLPLLVKLKHYELAGTVGTSEWKLMLDAVRNHPNRLEIRWDCAEVSLYCNTANESNDKKDEDCWMDVQRSLQNYLAGKGRWNKCMRMWFENEDADASGSEAGED